MGINISVMRWMDHANVSAQTTHASYPLTHPVHHYHYHYYIRLTAFSRMTWVSRHQKGKSFCILLAQEMMEWQWH